jgi:hypothetical protein
MFLTVSASWVCAIPYSLLSGVAVAVYRHFRRLLTYLITYLLTYSMEQSPS